MTGKDAIIEQIRTDAQLKANSTLEEGSKRADEIIAVAKNDARIYKDKNMAESYVEREEIIKRRETVAKLEGKKLLLLAKKTAIDNAFEASVSAIKKDKEAYKALISRMLNFAEDGDVVVLAKADKGLVSEDFIAECGRKMGKKITVSPERGDFCGGIILSGKGSDKNLSLERELQNIRDEYEIAISEILFGE